MPYQILDRPAGTSAMRATTGDQLFDAGRKLSAAVKKAIIAWAGGAATGAGAGAGTSAGAGAASSGSASGAISGSSILGSDAAAGETATTSGASKSSFKDALKKIIEKSGTEQAKPAADPQTSAQAAPNPFLDYGNKAPVNMKIPQFAGSSPAMGTLISNMLASRRF